MSNIEIESYLRLARSQIKNSIIVDALKTFLSASKVCAQESFAQALSPDYKSIKEELELAEKLGVRWVAYTDDHYPKNLRLIGDPPILLSCLGDTGLFNKQENIAIVGSRNASVSGKMLAHDIANQLGMNDITVVSGLALGIDTEAHKGSIAHSTIAVLAGGVDSIYPLQNSRLYKEIQEKGLLVSDRKVGTKPMARLFPLRNRLISGISVATLVVEAQERSGSLVTANFAKQQNRKVMAIPGFPTDNLSQGTNRLIIEGANMVRGAKDIINLIKGKKLSHMSHVGIEEIELEDQAPEASKDCKKYILAILTKAPIAAEILFAQLPKEITISDFRVALMELELEGKIDKQRDLISLIA